MRVDKHMWLPESSLCAPTRQFLEWAIRNVESEGFWNDTLYHQSHRIVWFNLIVFREDILPASNCSPSGKRKTTNITMEKMFNG